MDRDPHLAGRGVSAAPDVSERAQRSQATPHAARAKLSDHFTKFIENYLTPDDRELPPNYDTNKLKQASTQRARGKKAKAAGKIDSAAGYDTKNAQEAWATFFSGYQGPRIRVFEISLQGPVNDQWPTKSYHRAVWQTRTDAGECRTNPPRIRHARISASGVDG